MELKKIELNLSDAEIYFLGKSLWLLHQGSRKEIAGMDKEDIKPHVKFTFHHSKNLFVKLAQYLPEDFYVKFEKQQSEKSND